MTKVSEIHTHSCRRAHPLIVVSKYLHTTGLLPLNASIEPLQHHGLLSFNVHQSASKYFFAFYYFIHKPVLFFPKNTSYHSMRFPSLVFTLDLKIGECIGPGESIAVEAFWPRKRRLRSCLGDFVHDGGL